MLVSLAAAHKLIRKARGDIVPVTLTNSDPEKQTGVGARATNKVIHSSKQATSINFSQQDVRNLGKKCSLLYNCTVRPGELLAGNSALLTLLNRRLFHCYRPRCQC